MNLASLVEGHDAEHRALYDGERWYTWGEVRSRAAAVAAGLSELGVGAGDRVAIVWPTSVDFVLAYLGVLAAGAVAVPLNPLSPATELERELAVAEPRAALLGRARHADGGPTAGHVPGEATGTTSSAGLVGVALAGVPIVVAASELLSGEATPASSTTLRWEDLISSSSGPGNGSLHARKRSDEDLAVLLFTSGTAGEPKAAMLTHGNLVANLRQMLAVADMVRSDDVALVALPLFHVFGLNVALGLALATGAALVLEERFDATQALRQVRELGVTTLVGVPTMFAAWAGVVGPDSSDADGALPSVRRAISGAAALDADVAARFEARFGVAVWQGYGLTEASPAVSTSLGTGRNRPGSVGQPLPGVEIMLADDAGEAVLEGDPGEIWVRGPNVFAGYWRDEAATRAVVDNDGWLHTGDIGVIGDDGDLFVVERSKDLVIVSGFNVFPAEVERVVTDVPGVAEAVVVGRPDPVTGEAVEVVVVPEPGAHVTAEEVRAHCAAHLARYKCPTSVRFESDLPRGLVGKALRRELRQQTS